MTATPAHPHTLQQCADEVISAIEATLADPVGQWTDLGFSQLALRIFHAQLEQVPVYQQWVDLELGSRGMDASDVRRWQDIPALPIEAFKRTRVAPDADPDAPDEAIWNSSTTTGTTPSAHHLRSLAVYNASLRAGSILALLPDPLPATPPVAVQLAPGTDELPTSSLGHMLDTIRTELARDGGVFATADSVDADAAWSTLEDLAKRDEPVLVLSTSFGLVHLLEATADRPALRLPYGSRVMDTGGYKGRAREYAREELVELVGERLGVPAEWMENEYGMSELSSQAWLGTIAHSLRKPLPGHVPVPPAGASVRWQPPWMRTRVVHPVTLEPVGEGETGVLVHHDLANVWSCAAIRTEDLGIRRGNRWEFAGRAEGADLRGCSLRLEDLLL